MARLLLPRFAAGVCTEAHRFRFELVSRDMGTSPDDRIQPSPSSEPRALKRGANPALWSAISGSESARLAGDRAPLADVSSPLHLFEAVGVEIEYALVDRGTLKALQAVDQLLRRISGSRDSEVEVGSLCASNELALHVVELKVPEPVTSFEGVAQRFQRGVQRVNQAAADLDAMLLPTGMHPLFDPVAETRLWAGEDAQIYREFDRLFDCWQHGWSNIQSTHLNLSYCGDEEFGRLHAAIRIVLPILPVLAASSPVVEGSRTGMLDSRLRHYRTNAPRAPGITGPLIPEPIFTEQEYRTAVLEPIAHDLRATGAADVLDPEWVNARAAIPRFSRGSVEIRLLDTQECPAADVAVALAATECIRALVEERWCSYATQKRWSTEALDHILKLTSAVGGDALIWDQEYWRLFGQEANQHCTARRLWQALVHRLLEADTPARAPLQLILEEGCLARRILRVVGSDMSRARIRAVYAQLAECLQSGRLFRPNAV